MNKEIEIRYNFKGCVNSIIFKSNEVQNIQRVRDLLEELKIEYIVFDR